MPRLHTSDSWKKLEQLGEDTKLSTIEELFREDPSRSTQHSLELNGLYLDCSRNQIDKRIKSLLLSLCDQAHVSDQINAMFSGKKLIFPKIERSYTQRFDQVRKLIPMGRWMTSESQFTRT